MLFHVEFHVGFLSVDIRHLHHIILISFHGQPAGKATMFLDFNPIFVETAQFLSAKRKIVWLRTILRYAANELRTYRTPPKRHSDVIICPKKRPVSSSLPFLEKSLHAFILPVYQCVKVNFPLFFPSPPIGFHWTTRKVKRCKLFTLTHYKTRSMRS